MASRRLAISWPAVKPAILASAARCRKRQEVTPRAIDLFNLRWMSPASVSTAFAVIPWPVTRDSPRKTDHGVSGDTHRPSQIEKANNPAVTPRAVLPTRRLPFTVEISDRPQLSINNVCLFRGNAFREFHLADGGFKME